MAPNRIMRGGAARRAPWILALCLALALGLGACGGGGEKTTTVTLGKTAAGEVDEEADAGLLDEILTRQRAVAAAYERAVPRLQGQERALAQLFLAQQQEHIDGLLKAFRALGEKTEPGEETIEASGLKSPADFLLFFYEMEAATIAAEISAIADLTSPTARSTLSSTVANQAQHLVLLRRALGASVAESVPFPFENGTAPAP
jgi:hypothetical protein